MTHQLLLDFVFGLGLFIQSLFLVRRNFKKEDVFILLGCIFISLFFSLILALYVLEEISVSLHNVLIIFYFSFPFFFYGLFRNKILLEINKQIIIVWNAIFLYIYIINFGLPIKFTAFFLLPVIISLIIVFLPFKLKLLWKTFLYIWFLLVMIFIAFFQFDFNNLSFFFENSTNQSINLIDSLLAGMVFFYIIVHSIFILIMIPITDTDHKYKHRLKEIREHAIMLSEKYLESDIDLIWLFIIMFFIGCLVINFYEKFIPDSILINFFIIILTANFYKPTKI